MARSSSRLAPWQSLLVLLFYFPLVVEAAVGHSTDTLLGSVFAAATTAVLLLGLNQREHRIFKRYCFLARPLHLKCLNYGIRFTSFVAGLSCSILDARELLNFVHTYLTWFSPQQVRAQQSCPSISSGGGIAAIIIHSSRYVTGGEGYSRSFSFLFYPVLRTCCLLA